MRQAEKDLPEDVIEARERRADLLVRFAKGAASARFMTRLGRALSQAERRLAESYLAALGFPDAAIVGLSDFWEAAEAAEARDFDSAAWEAAEQLRIGLSIRAVETMGSDRVEWALTDTMAVVAPIVREAVADAAGGFDIEDEALINSATGACLRACHNAALVLLAGEADEHALALEYALFEAGRWPVALTGQTLHLF